MRNLHRILSDKYGIEAQHLLSEWEKLQIKDSNYRNHQIFRLRCISKGITPVSIRLKTTGRKEKERQMIRKTERDLLKARVKSINSLLDNSSKQRDICRSKLTSIFSTVIMQQCQELIDKVRKLMYLKVMEK